MFRNSRVTSILTTSFLTVALGIALNPFSAFGGVGPEVYWYADGTVERMSIDGTQRETLFSNMPGGQGLDVSPQIGKMYWTNIATGQIQRANLDGSGQEVILTETGMTREVIIDASAGHIYWSNSDLDKIQRANLDGSGAVDVVTNVGFVSNMHLDSANGRLYFSESATDTVRRVDLDGSNHVTLLSSTGPGGGDPRGVDIDLARGHIYYSDLKRDAIFRADLDGSNEITFVSGLASVFDLQILPETDEIFWFENVTRQLYRSPLGTADPTVIETDVFALSMALTPEPGTIAIVGLGISMIGVSGRQRRKNRG